MPYIDLDISHFSIFRAPLGLLEMPHIDLDISHLSSIRAPLPAGTSPSSCSLETSLQEVSLQAQHVRDHCSLVLETFQNLQATSARRERFLLRPQQQQQLGGRGGQLASLSSESLLLDSVFFRAE